MIVVPDSRGWFGAYGGRFAPETLMGPLIELERVWCEASRSIEFRAELDGLLTEYVGRPTPLSFAPRLTAELGGAKIYLKREDLTHTGAHKINNAVGQVLLARRMGKTRIVAETGAGQHGVATATVATRFGLRCCVYMGRVDMERQQPNVDRMRLLGAEVVPVDTGTRTLKDAVSEAMRDWVGNLSDTYYLLGSALGPHPYPLMVRELQAIIGNETRRQILAREGRLPDHVVACVGGGSNSIGMFQAFLGDPEVALVGVEAGGQALAAGEHAARFAGGALGVLQGTQTIVLQTDSGQIDTTHSISAGLDYAAVGPEHAYLRESGRARYVHQSDAQALTAFKALARLEGILPALESAHAIAYAMKLAPWLPADQIIVVCLSGRGDKDLATVLASDPAACAERMLSRAPSPAPLVVAQTRRSNLGRKVLFIPFVVAGDPRLEVTAQMLDTLIEEGADAVEIGIPFSDALADGPVIQAAAERACGTSASQVLELVEQTHRRHPKVPLILFTYYNPVLRMGVDVFVRRARAAGAWAALVVDLPVEEAEPFCSAAAQHDLKTIFLAAPTTSDARLAAVGEASSAFVYCVSRAGVTGERAGLSPSLRAEVERVRRLTRRPVAVGFGISTPEQAAQVAEVADSVVVGSAFVRLIAEGGHQAQDNVRALARAIKAALPRGP